MWVEITNPDLHSDLTQPGLWLCSCFLSTGSWVAFSLLTVQQEAAWESQSEGHHGAPCFP